MKSCLPKCSWESLGELCISVAILPPDFWAARLGQYCLGSVLCPSSWTFKLQSSWGWGEKWWCWNIMGFPLASTVLDLTQMSLHIARRSRDELLPVTTQAHGSSSAGAVPGPVAVAPPGDFWEMQALRPHPRSPDSVTLGLKPNNVCFNEKWLIFMRVNLKNHWHRTMDTDQCSYLGFPPFFPNVICVKRGPQ